MLQSPGRRPMTGVRSRHETTLDIQPEVLVVDHDAKLGLGFGACSNPSAPRSVAPRSEPEHERPRRALRRHSSARFARHVLVFGEGHVLRRVTEYARFY